MMSQESLNRLRHGVVPIEIALVGEAIDLRFRGLYQGQVDATALARAMCLHSCRGGRTSFSHLLPFPYRMKLSWRSSSSLNGKNCQ
jgi:hypothetical protein